MWALLVCIYLAQTSCAQPTVRKATVTSEHWVYHPSVVLALSQAILDGMRRLINDLLISEKWYKDMDISVISNKSELLRVRVTDLVLQEQASGKVFTQWRIYLLQDETLEHLNTINMDNNNDFQGDSLGQEVLSDSLFLNVYSSTSQLSLDNGEPVSSTIELIYWRDISKNDEVVKLRVSINPLKHLNRKQ